MAALLIDPAATIWVKITDAKGEPVKGLEEAEFEVGYLPPLEAKRILPTLTNAAQESQKSKDAKAVFLESLKTDLAYADAARDAVQLGVRAWRGIATDTGERKAQVSSWTPNGGSRAYPMLSTESLDFLDANGLVEPLALRVFLNNTLSAEEKKRRDWPRKWSGSDTSAVDAPPVRLVQK